MTEHTEIPRQQAVIASLAILKVNSDHGADYIDNFVPFVGECLRKATADEVSLGDLQVQMKSEFGLEVPQAALRSVLDRAVRAGFATREHRLYRRNKAALDASGFESSRQRALREVTALVDGLRSHSMTLLPEPWTTEAAETALLHYLASRGTSLLASASERIPIALPSGVTPNAEYVIASFLDHIQVADPVGFEYLSTAVKGSVLASVLYFEDFGSIGRHFEPLALYLDTVVLVQALGLMGPEFMAPSTEMMNLATDLGATLNCFQDTVSEVDGILTFASRYVRSGRPHDIPIWGATEYLVNTGKSASDIELIAAHLADDLANLGINIRPRPKHEIALTLDELAFGKFLRDSIRYRAPEPLQHDLDAITSIHRLRRGEALPKIEGARALFVTTNTSLARATNKFFRTEYGVPVFAPLCMPAHQFGTLAWLKKPQAAPDLITKFIISDAIAALNPPEGLWREYVREISKLEQAGNISSDDCELLRYSPAAKAALMGVTVGGSRAYLEGSVPEILERVRAAERREALEEAARERSLREGVERHAQQSIETQALAHAVEIAAATSEMEKKGIAAEVAYRARQARYLSIGRSVGRALGLSVTGLFMIVAALGLYGVGGLKFAGELPFSGNPVIGIALLVVGLVGVFLSVTGAGLREYLRPREERVARNIARRIERRFEGGDEPGGGRDEEA